MTPLDGWVPGAVKAKVAALYFSPAFWELQRMFVGTLPVRSTVPMPLLAWDRKVEAGGEQSLVLYGEACLRRKGGK